MTSIEEVKQKICEKYCKYKATQDKVKEKYNSSDHECIICCELCALEELHGEDFVSMADKIDNMIDTICELGNGITEEDVKRESKILFEIRDQLYEVGGWDGNEPNHKKKTGHTFSHKYHSGGYVKIIPRWP